MVEYEQDSTITLYATFLTQTGEEAAISGTPTISLYHRKGNIIETDVDNQDMTQLTGTTYYYRYYIPSNADKTIYIARYAATYIDSSNVKGSEFFQVIVRKFWERGKTGGHLTIRDTWSKEEKKKLIEKIGELFKGLKLIKETAVKTKIMQIDSYQDNIKLLDKTMKDFVIKIQDLKSFTEKDLENIKNQQSKQSQSMKSQQFKDKNEIIKEIENKAEVINKLKSNIEKLKINYIKEFKKIKLDINDLTEMVVKIMPTEVIEEMLENEKPISKRV